MLKEIRIKNYAIIDHIELSFDDGLIIFTGETGAGKSIIMDALDTLLGGRADISQIRTGADQASLEATFRLDGQIKKPIHAILKREALLDDPDFLILGREIRRNNRNIARVNGRSVGLSLVKEIGDFLVDIHGQSEHLSLLQIRHHLNLLDRYSDIEGALIPYKKSYKQYIDVKQTLEDLRMVELDAARRMDLLTYQINEIETAKLLPGEEEQLAEEHTRLANAEELTSIVIESLKLIDDGPPEEPTISGLFGNLISSLTNLGRVDHSQIETGRKASHIFEEISELNTHLRNYQETIEFNQNRLNQVEDRIGLINNLKRKYGETIESVLSFASKAKSDLENITNASDRILELEAEKERLLSIIAEEGMILSRKRRDAANRLQFSLGKELTDLKMPGARFKVDFKRTPDPDGVFLPNGDRVAFNANGIEQIEFHIETNPGEGFKPLIKIASGGETSRFMLALKNILAKADHVPTLVFDEIDQGIGGRVGSIVGHKLWLLSSQHQVMCITHLPQLAAFGHQHYRVEKAIDSGRTITQVEQVEGENRVFELAQMLGEVKSGMIQSARELLVTVEDIKEEHTRK